MTQSLTSGASARFQNNVDWALKDHEIRKLEREIELLRSTAKTNTNAKSQLKILEAQLRKLKNNSI